MENQMAVYVKFRGHSILSLVPNSVAESFDSFDFGLIQVEPTWGERFTLLAGDRRGSGKTMSTVTGFACFRLNSLVRLKLRETRFGELREYNQLTRQSFI
jgi:hypothetical protein